MPLIERDEVTGHATTGHAWDGIRELNTPAPRIVLFFLAATFLYSLVSWVLLPAWPLGSTYTKGLLGVDQHAEVEARLAAARAERAGWEAEIVGTDLAEVQGDLGRLGPALAVARTLFNDNCAVCHGVDGGGGPGFPALTGGSWLWGGEPETIAETIRVGINAAHPETRFAQMPAFGRDGMLPRDQLREVAAYVQSLSGVAGPEATPERVAAGAPLFAENCAGCHGEDARGSRDLGAPDLTDAQWIYGGDWETLMRTLIDGRAGHMPHWSDRLSEAEIRALALHVGTLAEDGR